MKTINRNIEMICETELDGTVHPIKFKIKDKQAQPQVYEILRIFKMESKKLGGNKMKKYICQININETNRNCEIKFEHDTCKWTLFKI